MGTFRIEVQAVGGHGCQRQLRDGSTVEMCGDPNCPDCAARRFVAELKAHHNNVESARLIHWPGTKEEVVDDLITKVRKGSF